jgi:hypothetical protein
MVRAHKRQPERSKKDVGDTLTTERDGTYGKAKKV